MRRRREDKTMEDGGGSAGLGWKLKSVASDRTTGMWLSLALCNTGSCCQDARLGLPCLINQRLQLLPFQLT